MSLDNRLSKPKNKTSDNSEPDVAILPPSEVAGKRTRTSYHLHKSQSFEGG